MVSYAENVSIWWRHHADSRNCLSPARSHAIIWIPADLMSIRHPGKCQLNFNQITDIFLTINEAENKTCEMATILPRYQCVHMVSSHCKLPSSKTTLIAWPAWLPIIRCYVSYDNLQTGFAKSIGTFWPLYWVSELYMLLTGAFIDISNAL